MPLERPIVHYFIKLWVDDQRIPTKPFIMNTLGNVCIALFRELKDFSTSGLIDLKMQPHNPPDQRVVLTVDETPIFLKEFVQDLVWNTIMGYLSVLNKVPAEREKLMQKSIRIQISEKSKK